MASTQPMTSFFQPVKINSPEEADWSYGVWCTMTLNWRGVDVISCKTVSTYREKFAPPPPYQKIRGCAPAYLPFRRRILCIGRGTKAQNWPTNCIEDHDMQYSVHLTGFPEIEKILFNLRLLANSNLCLHTFQILGKEGFSTFID